MDIARERAKDYSGGAGTSRTTTERALRALPGVWNSGSGPEPEYGANWHITPAYFSFLCLYLPVVS
jgi:hypothetical protein